MFFSFTKVRENWQKQIWFFHAPCVVFLLDQKEKSRGAWKKNSKWHCSQNCVFSDFIEAKYVANDGIPLQRRKTSNTDYGIVCGRTRHVDHCTRQTWIKLRTNNTSTSEVGLFLPCVWSGWTERFPQHFQETVKFSQQIAEEKKRDIRSSDGKKKFLAFQRRNELRSNSLLRELCVGITDQKGKRWSVHVQVWTPVSGQQNNLVLGVFLTKRCAFFTGHLIDLQSRHNSFNIDNWQVVLNRVLDTTVS